MLLRIGSLGLETLSLEGLRKITAAFLGMTLAVTLLVRARLVVLLWGERGFEGLSQPPLMLVGRLQVDLTRSLVKVLMRVV